MLSFFALSEVDYASVVKQARAVVDLEAALPAWPFRVAHAKVDICQYELLLSGDFERVLQELARVHGDTFVYLLVLDPPAIYFRGNYGLFPALTVPIELIRETYWDALTHEPGGNTADALAFSAERVVVVGSSASWAIWGQRDWDLAILVSPSRSRPWQYKDVPFVNARDALEEFVVPSFRERPLSAAQLSGFIETFSDRAR
jgi:hypothetical protein